MASIGQLRELAERLEKATGPDRELDADILLAMPTAWMVSRKQEFTNDLLGWLRSKDYSVKSDAYTASVDAALALVERLLPGTLWSVAKCCIESGGTIYEAFIWSDPDDSPIGRSEDHPTPALAILCAIVDAMISQAEVP